MKVLKFYPIVLITLIIFSLARLISPSPTSAQDLQLKWHQMDTPGSVSGKNDIVSPCEVNGMALGSDGKTFYVVDIPWVNIATGEKALYKSIDSGISWDDHIGKYLFATMSGAEQANFRVLYIAVAPDDVNYIAVVTNNTSSNLPSNVWLSKDGGTTWVNSLCPASANISAITVSPMAGDNRDVAIGTRTGVGTGNIWTMNSQRLFNWSRQELSGDIISLKFSPGYSNDNTLVIVFSNMLGTYLTAGIRDIVGNVTNWAVIYQQGPIEITTKGAGSSPKANQIISADLSLPDSYTSQIATARKYFISIDCPLTAAGIYRFDDSAGCQLMIATASKRISSIAYHGSLSSGKLLAGEVLGSTCTASVMTWFTDNPFMCAVPCWYPAIKPPTGGAGNSTGTSYGNASVAWSQDGSIAFAGTASTDILTGGGTWPNAYLVGRALDESAFSQSNDNGETWNSLSLIDTSISNLVDIAPTPDCTKIYLASINDNMSFAGFDSVWRSRSTPLGSAWERVLCAMTNGDNCTATQSDVAIIRLAGDKPDGEALIWSAPGTNLVKWSINYGDSWNNLHPAWPVQDIAFEDSKALYILNPNGQVQKFGYSGTGWMSQSNISSGIDPAYSIATAYTGMTPDNAEGTVLVGGTGVGTLDVAYSTDNATNFKQIIKNPSIRDKTMVVASSSFNSSGGGDGYILAINSGGMFAYSINTTGNNPWEEWWGGAGYGSPDPITGLCVSRNGSYYFCDAYSSPYIRWNYATAGWGWLSLGSSPTTRWRTCGGLILEQPTITYAIDQRPFSPPAGGIWYYVDDLLWSGPRPTSPVNHFKVSCDPVTGRAGQIELKWLPRSLSKGYDVYIAKDIDFYMTIAKIGDVYGKPYTPPDPDHPALWIPPGGGTITDSNGNSWTVPELEAGHSYYWKVMVKQVATGDAITSPWSWRESYDVRPGFKVATPYPGVQLLSPAKGCTGCSAKPAFSWSPYQGATGYCFLLAKDADMKQVIVQVTTPATAYEYDSPLAADSVYFWQVRAVDSDGRPTSDWSATFSLKTGPAPAVAPAIAQEQGTPLWVWCIIALGSIGVITILALIIRTLTI
jgi:hypothetical protein